MLVLMVEDGDGGVTKRSLKVRSNHDGSSWRSDGGPGACFITRDTTAHWRTYKYSYRGTTVANVEGILPTKT